jgi:GNAT superfamily N-acetyltransferase
MILIEDDRHGRACAETLVAAGYQHETDVIMCGDLTAGPDPAGPDRAGADPAGAGADPGGADPAGAEPGVQVAQVSAADLAEGERRLWRNRLPAADQETIRQLVERRATLAGAADQVSFLAVRDGAGVVRSRADLYVDPASGMAQIEDLATDPRHLRRGYARAILAEARRRAVAAGCTRAFLVADADDWPSRWYARLGYRPVGAFHLFTRALPAAPEGSRSA